MKYSEKFFRFPVRLYLSKDIEKRRDLEESLGIELESEDPEFLVGWDCVDPNDIRGFGTIFSRGKTMADVRENGFDSTIVYLAYGKEVGCAWPPAKFEKKLNEFIDLMEEERKKEGEAKFKEQTEVLKIEFEKQLTEELVKLLDGEKKSWISRAWSNIKALFKRPK